MPQRDGPSCPGCGLPNYEGLCPVCRGDEQGYRDELEFAFGPWHQDSDERDTREEQTREALEELATNVETAIFVSRTGIARAIRDAARAAARGDTRDLPCGHSFTDVVSADEGTSYCGACARAEKQT